MLTTKSIEFKKYGFELDGDFSDIIDYLINKTPMPNENNLYVRDDEKMHKLKSFEIIQKEVFGGSNIECGYCNGYNSYLNCLEYHGCFEVNIASCDQVLILASFDDIENGIIDSKKCKTFLIKKNQAIVLNPLTLHFSPCKLSDDGFKMAIILLDGTNKDLTYIPKDKTLFKENKWLYAHKDSKQAKNGAYVGLVGENIKINY